MVLAFILITAKSGYEKSIVDELQDIDGVEEVEILYGEYDLIAKIKVDSIDQLGTFIMENIRPVEGVERTSTLIVAS